MDKKLKWQEKIDKEVKEFSNEDLLDEVIRIAGGDDYDGCFTTEGNYKYDVYIFELKERLKQIGFLK